MQSLCSPECPVTEGGLHLCTPQHTAREPLQCTSAYLASDKTMPCVLVPGKKVYVDFSNTALKPFVFCGHVWGCSAQANLTMRQLLFLVGTKREKQGRPDGSQRTVWYWREDTTLCCLSGHEVVLRPPYSHAGHNLLTGSSFRDHARPLQ